MLDSDFTNSILTSAVELYAGMEPDKKAEFRKQAERYPANTSQKRRGKAAFMYLLDQMDAESKETE